MLSLSEFWVFSLQPKHLLGLVIGMVFPVLIVKKEKKKKNTSVLVGLIPPDKVSIFIVKESSKGGLARGERRILKNCDKGHNEKELGPANRHQFQLHPSNCLFPDTAHNMKMYHNRGMML
jgi:hypothetical protein